jgi:hypothetical protein
MLDSLVVSKLYCLSATVFGKHIRKSGYVKPSGRFEKVNASEGDGVGDTATGRELLQIITNIRRVEVCQNRVGIFNSVCEFVVTACSLVCVDVLY